MEDYRKIAIELGQTLISKAPETREDVERMLPELKESEDEKIRKALISVFSNREKYLIDQSFGDITVSEALAWLEKQGKNNMGISEATKLKLEENLNKALEKETPESWNEFLEKQGEQKPILDVEIPFGAKDSELKEVTYDIPKGYHAEIDGNKVVIKQGEHKSADWSEEDT